ncbi:MAG: hypothetical protein HYY37_04155 [Candidatus Aenigmarchaeota archaeon]|nr:hypothetical protein [Candidatus Aenigmarchaeota archaeon]
MFYDLHAHTTLSIGENSIEEMAAMAKRLGLSGIGVVRYHDTTEELPAIDGIDIISVIIIKAANADELAKVASNVRSTCEILMVHGGDYSVNRAACENPLIDVLCHPELGRKDSGLDHVCLKAAHDNNVAIEINFREILESYKRKRVYIMAGMKKNVRLAQKYGAPVITTSGAVSKYGMRSGRELAAITHLLGLELGDAIHSTSALPESIVRVNREKLAGKRWEGVHIVGE